MNYLAARGIDIVKVDFDEDAARAAVARQTHNIVLEIPADFGQRLQAGEPAPVILYSDSSRGFERRGVARVRALVANYGIEIAQLRFLARGIDPVSVLPISVQEIDVSTPTGRSVLVLNMMTYLVLLSMLFGGLYLAIDATAGERERGSLEVLLTSPVPREQLIYGKIVASASYMLISLVLTVIMFSIAMSFVGLEQLGITANLGPHAAAHAGGLLRAVDPVRLGLPHHHFGLRQDLSRGADLSAAGDHHSHHAADLRGPAWPADQDGRWMFVPFLSQHLLMTTVVRAEPILPLHLLVSVGSTIFYGVILTYVGRHACTGEKPCWAELPAADLRRIGCTPGGSDFGALLREQGAVAEDLAAR